MSLEILKSKIESIYKLKHLKNIFKIIFESNEHYIINDCGVFVPLNKLKPDTVEKEENYINGIVTNVINIDELKQAFTEKDQILNLPRHERRIYNKYILKF